MSNTVIEQTLKINRLTINSLELDLPEPKVSDSLFPLEQSSEVINDFFQKHFIDTRQGKAKSCKFLDRDATIKTKIDRFYSNPSDEDFVKFSQEVTESLFKIMKNSSSNSSGTFFVMDVEYNNEMCIFLIKLDPKQGVQVDLEDLIVSVLENILPDSNDRVHKCAIIRYNIPASETTELFVMDKQQREGEPARFFIENFLQAEELLNDRIITSEVIKSAKEHFTSILPELDNNLIYDAIDREFTNGTRKQLRDSVTNILEEVVPGDKVDRDIFLSSSTNDFIDEYTQKFPDHQTSFIVERKDKVIVYKGDSNQVYFRYNKGIRKQINVGDDENGNTVIVINKSLNLTQELK